MPAPLSDRTPQQAIAALLARYQPERLLVVGSPDLPAIKAFSQAQPNSNIDHAETGKLPAEFAAKRYDLALLVGCLEHMDKRHGLQLLGGIRNLNANRLAVLIDLKASGWEEKELFALALQVSERFQRNEQILTLFTYDLLDYKQVPDWLNAKFWANPENFGKYWW